MDFTYSLVIRGEAPSIIIHNKGGGPATIKKITLIAGDIRIDATDTAEYDEGVSEFINEVAKQRRVEPIGNAAIIHTLSKDDVLNAGEDVQLIIGRDEIAKDDAKNKLLSECIRQLVFEVEAESLYHEKILIRSQGPEKSFFTPTSAGSPPGSPGEAASPTS